jgi:hypothetical protein
MACRRAGYAVAGKARDGMGFGDARRRDQKLNKIKNRNLESRKQKSGLPFAFRPTDHGSEVRHHSDGSFSSGSVNAGAMPQRISSFICGIFL